MAFFKNPIQPGNPFLQAEIIAMFFDSNFKSKYILHLIKNAKHFSVRCSYTGRNKSPIFANLFRTGITGREKEKTNYKPILSR